MKQRWVYLGFVTTYTFLPLYSAENFGRVWTSLSIDHLMIHRLMILDIRESGDSI